MLLLELSTQIEFAMNMLTHYREMYKVSVETKDEFLMKCYMKRIEKLEGIMETALENALDINVHG